MSHRTEGVIDVTSLAELVKAVVESGMEVLRQKQLQSSDGKTHAVDLVMNDAGEQVGVAFDKASGKARFIARQCGSKGAEQTVGKVLQRYACSRVIEELKRKGYEVGKEERQPDGTVRLVASRWK